MEKITSNVCKRIPQWLSSKESTCNARDMASIPGKGRSPGEGDGSPLQYPCLETPWMEGPHGLQSVGINVGSRVPRHCLSSAKAAAVLGKVWSQGLCLSAPSSFAEQMAHRQEPKNTSLRRGMVATAPDLESSGDFSPLHSQWTGYKTSS